MDEHYCVCVCFSFVVMETMQECGGGGVAEVLLLSWRDILTRLCPVCDMGEFFQAYRPLCVVSDLIHTHAAKRLRCTCAQEREGRMGGKSEINHCPLHMEPRWRYLKIQYPR